MWSNTLATVRLFESFKVQPDLTPQTWRQVSPGCARFTSLRLNRKGTLLLASSLDKYARLFEVNTAALTEEGFTAQDAQQTIQSRTKARLATVLVALTSCVEV